MHALLITNNAHQKLISAITLLFRPKVYRVLTDLEQANSKIISYKKENQFIHSVHDKLILITMRRDRDSNPGYPFGVYTLSRRASSTTRAPLLFSECKNRTNFQNQQIFESTISLFIPRDTTINHDYASDTPPIPHT